MLPLQAAIRPVELPPATVGQPYAYALGTNKPARFLKSGGNADWLTVTPEGILTGIPPGNGPAIATIAVEARSKDQQSDPEPLRGWFVITVQSSTCGDREHKLQWCDPGTAATAPVAGRPSQVEPLGFAPEEKEAESTSSIDDDPECGDNRDQVRPNEFKPNGCVVQFDRLHGNSGELGHYNPRLRRLVWTDVQLGDPLPGSLKSNIVRSIDGSKVLMSGSVLIRRQVEGCQFYSWSVITETVDSSNNLFYGPSDLTAFCEDKTLLIVLPVHVIWANVYGITANTNDPAWRPVSAPGEPHECWTGARLPTSPTQGIKLCDLTGAPPPGQFRDERPSLLLKKIGYSNFNEWLYNRGEQPGVSQGSISIAPVAATTKSTIDMQMYESWQYSGRPGWVGFQGMYEHDRKPADDLNSLTAELTYDYRICNNRRYWWESEEGTEGAGKCSIEIDHHSDHWKPGNLTPPAVGIRPAEFLVRFGPEWAPSAEKVKSGTSVYVPRDLNMVAGGSVRIPIVFNPVWQAYARTPSQLAISLVEGVEIGTRMAPHPIRDVWEPREILRQTPGVDASFRWPYNLTKNFLGDKPLTIDFSYRDRLLYRAEPFFNETNLANGLPIVKEWQDNSARPYMRVNYIVPFSAYLQFRTTWQHGQLPPAFQYVGNLVTVGFTFSNPGSSEH